MLRAASLLLSITLLGCAGAPAQAIAPLAMPRDASARRSSLTDLGKQLFEGLRGGGLGACFVSPDELDALIVPEGRFRLAHERADSVERLGTTGAFQRDWASASFVGFCAQGAREEPARMSLGLTQPGWVLDRILVVADLGRGSARSASWLEGAFVYTGRGWKALHLDRIEPPRRQHSDLELAQCDVEAGLR